MYARTNRTSLGRGGHAGGCFGRTIEGSPRIALLCDLDNVTAGVNADAALADQITERCDGTNLLCTAGHRDTYRQHRERLAAIGITVISGGQRPQGADQEPLHYGHIVARRGVSTFVVASNDGTFARVPPHALLPC